MSYIYISADPRELGGARQRSNPKYAKSERKALKKEEKAAGRKAE
jgi:hypothetical protein